jgi:hypothetical protein
MNTPRTKGKTPDEAGHGQGLGHARPGPRLRQHAPGHGRAGATQAPVARMFLHQALCLQTAQGFGQTLGIGRGLITIAEQFLGL